MTVTDTRPPRRGLRIVEVLIPLAITATLLVAVASAYSASMAAIRVNDQFFRATQAARVSVTRILADVRQAAALTTNDDQLNVEDENGTHRLYAYDAANRVITLSFPDAVPVKTYTLARNVDSMVFSTDDQTIAVLLTVRYGENQLTLSGSAMPRQTMPYH